MGGAAAETLGIVKGELMVRVGPTAYASLVRQPHAREMDFTGKPMNGLLYVDADGVESDAVLRRWIGHGAAYARSLPRKPARPGREA